MPYKHISEEIRQRIREQHRIYARDSYRGLSPEEKIAWCDRLRAKKTPEQREHARLKAAERYAALSPEQKKIRNEKSRIYASKNKDSLTRAARKCRLKTAYSMTVEEFDSMVAKQNGKCAICECDAPGGPFNVWYIDHCHRSGKVRELLCFKCNLGLGKFRDQSSLLRKAADYIDRHTPLNQ